GDSLPPKSGCRGWPPAGQQPGKSLMKSMKAAEPGSTGAPETSALHQLSAGNSGPGGDPGSAPPRVGPAAPARWPGASAATAASTATARIEYRRVARMRP